MCGYIFDVQYVFMSYRMLLWCMMMLYFVLILVEIQRYLHLDHKMGRLRYYSFHDQCKFAPLFLHTSVNNVATKLTCFMVSWFFFLQVLLFHLSTSGRVTVLKILMHYKEWISIKWQLLESAMLCVMLNKVFVLHWIRRIDSLGSVYSWYWQCCCLYYI